MRWFLIVFAAFLLTVAVAAAAVALLPACGVLMPALGVRGFCKPAEAVAAEARLAELDAANAALAVSIAALERELGALQCMAETALPPARAESGSGAIDTEAWETGDVAVLDGCWTLDSDFQTTNRRTGVTSHYSAWEMCFDADGKGREEMRADTGATCAGTVTGRFDDAGALVIEEPGNLQCSDGGYIYRLVTRCTLNQDGTASCRVRQPEVGSAASVSFRRATGDN